MATRDSATIPTSEPPLEQPLEARLAEFPDVLPVDRDRPFYPELYPRDPDAYEPLPHFYQRQKEPERMLTKSIDGFSAVRKTILAGDLRDNKDGCGVFVFDHHGVEYYVVVGFHLKEYRIAVSGWPMLRDKYEAIESGYWAPSELEQVEQFNEQHFAKHE